MVGVASNAVTAPGKMLFMLRPMRERGKLLRSVMFLIKEALWIQIIAIQAVLNARALILNTHPKVLMSRK